MVDLPEKYAGLTRIGLHEEPAREMQRVDDIVEANGIVTGDQVYIDIFEWKKLTSPDQKPERLTIHNPDSCIFVAVDNGRVITFRSAEKWAEEVAKAKSKGVTDERLATYMRGSDYRGSVYCVDVADIRKA